MTDDEGFLQRWSRRKRKTARDAGAHSENEIVRSEEQVSARPRESGDPAFAKEHAASDPRFRADERQGRGDERARCGIEREGDAAPNEEPPIDLSQLPALDSITETTDVRAFLARGVPATLTREALRRAWSVDPGIRDFVGLSENSWDFNAPDGVPGFGPLLSSNATAAAEDAVRFSQPDLDPALGDSRRVASTAIEQPTPASDAEAATGSQQQSQQIATNCHASGEGDYDSEISCCEPASDKQNQDVASQNASNPPDLDTTLPRPRRHGSALPR